jgi:hypothetical protein
MMNQAEQWRNKRQRVESGATTQRNRSSEGLENRNAGVAMSVSSLFKDLIVSAEGMPHFRSGAADYQTYLQRAEQKCEEVVDSGLPQYGEEEIQYEGDGRKGYWVAFNRRDNEGGRYVNTILEVHTVTSWLRCGSSQTLI